MVRRPRSARVDEESGRTLALGNVLERPASRNGDAPHASHGMV